MIFSNWNGSQWENGSKSEFVYDSYSNQTQYINYQWIDSKWVSCAASKFKYIYDSNGNMIQRILTEWYENQWNNMEKSEYAYDSNNKETQRINYHWVANQWTETNKYEFTFNNSYSSSDIIAPFITFKYMLTSQLYAVWDQTSNDWSINYKNTFYYSEQNTTPIADLNKGEFNVYPNPVSDILSVKYPDHYSLITFELYDLQGRKLMSTEIKSNEPISLKGIHKGMYIYYLITDGQKHKGKLIKE